LDSRPEAFTDILLNITFPQDFNATTSIREEAMSITKQFAGGRESMRLDARLPEGNVILCTGHGDEHSFLVRRLGLSIECPKCGRIALSADLIAEFYGYLGETLATQASSTPILNAPASAIAA
jgi:hypothetical protein